MFSKKRSSLLHNLMLLEDYEIRGK